MLKVLVSIFLLVFGYCAGAQVKINWSAYYPTSSGTVQTSRNANGTTYSNYVYLRYNQDAKSGFPYLFDAYLTPGTPVASVNPNVSDIGVKGFLGVWAKLYAGATEPATYGQLWFGNDNQVIETGDYLRVAPGTYKAFNYADTKAQTRSGLVWSPQVSGSAALSVVLPYYPGLTSPSSSLSAFSYVWAEVLPSFTPAYGAKNGVWGKGNGKTYSNVLHVLFYHGPSTSNNVDCSQVPGNQMKSLYAHVPGYNTYLSEYYLAPGKWIVQERTVYIEDASYWRANGSNIPNCTGGAFDLTPGSTFGGEYLDDRG